MCKKWKDHLEICHVEEEMILMLNNVTAEQLKEEGVVIWKLVKHLTWSTKFIFKFDIFVLKKILDFPNWSFSLIKIKPQIPLKKNL